MSYKVTSNRLAWPAGTTLTEDELAGVNVDALVAAGHLKPATKKSAKADTPETETEPTTSKE